MAEAKTKLTKQSVEKFINSIPDAQTREDCTTISRLMQQAMRAEPQMWGSSIVGFGVRHYKYASGRDQPRFSLINNLVSARIRG